MKKNLSWVLKLIITFLACAAISFGLLILSALIPRNAIKGNIIKSADYLCQKEPFHELMGGIRPTIVDHYADAILLNVAYHHDEKDPINSVMWSSYFYTTNHEETENLKIATTSDPGANLQYMRYWHGSIIIVKPLLLIMSIKGIYIFNAVVIALLLGWLLYKLFKNGYNTLAYALIIGLVATSVWIVPTALEYTWMVELMLLVCLVVISVYDKGREYKLPFIFVITGILTNFFDFLTTETMTLLVPILMYVWIGYYRRDNKDIKKLWKNVIIYSLLWGIGYVGMWLLKWDLAGLILRINPIEYVTEHITERLGNDITNRQIAFTLDTWWKNIDCLFPWAYTSIGKIAGIILVIFTLYFGYVYKKKGTDKKIIILLTVIGLVPFVRYAVLRNHSFLHCFFTHRALIASIMAIVLIIGELTKRSYKK